MKENRLEQNRTKKRMENRMEQNITEYNGTEQHRKAEQNGEEK